MQEPTVPRHSALLPKRLHPATVNWMSTSRIHVLEDKIARRIAAGEVIERPNSVLRELLDNAIDADATSIDVHLGSGGIDYLRVSDNGEGMSREDMELCWLSHATSKISSDSDLEGVMTLGFRGEALSSIAAVARLSVASAQRRDGGESGGTRMVVRDGSLEHIGSGQAAPGTTIEVRELFHNLPARKRFLKRPASETSACLQTFREKALAFPDRTFRLFTDERPKLTLPATSRQERVVQSFGEKLAGARFYSIEAQGEGFGIEIVLASPDYFRNDRKYLSTFVNGRRVWEYSLMQALEWGYADFMPGNTHPLAFLFVTLDPGLADFNIHPAKREVKIRNLGEVHHAVSRTVRGFCDSFRRGLRAQGELEGLEPVRASHNPDAVAEAAESAAPTAPSAGSSGPDAFPQPSEGGLRPAPIPDRPMDMRPAHSPHQAFRERALSRPEPGTSVISSESLKGHAAYRYLGQLFSLFFVVEHQETLYLIDMHAGHERVLFDQLRARHESQRLLVPFEFEASPELHEALAADNSTRLSELAAVGLVIEAADGPRYRILEAPLAMTDRLSHIPDALEESLAEHDVLTRGLYATMACRKAVKDGDIVDDQTAHRLIDQILALEHARCPHGRPIWFELSRDELFRLVGRGD